MKLSELKVIEAKEWRDTKSDMSSKEIVDDLVSFMHDQVKKHKHEEKEATSVPSAPDTTKFRATVGGMIEVSKSETIHSHGMSTTYTPFLKIGGGLPKVREAVLKDLYKLLGGITDGDYGTENTHIKASDGKIVSVAVTYGTNWGGIGIKVSK